MAFGAGLNPAQADSPSYGNSRARSAKLSCGGARGVRLASPTFGSKHRSNNCGIGLAEAGEALVVYPGGTCSFAVDAARQRSRAEATA